MIAGRKRFILTHHGTISGHLRQHHRNRGFPAGAAGRAAARRAEVGPHGDAATRRSVARQIPGNGFRRELRSRSRRPALRAAKLDEAPALKLSPRAILEFFHLRDVFLFPERSSPPAGAVSRSRRPGMPAYVYSSQSLLASYRAYDECTASET